MATLKDYYLKNVKDKLVSEFEISNAMLTPKLEKITISVGCGEGSKDAKLLQNIADTVSAISGQKAVITVAKKSVSGFKLREGMNVGVKVTLRGANMYNFLEKLITLSLPKVKDFKGLSRTGFDGRGNYSFGLSEQLIFPEVKYDNIVKIHGMNISISTSTDSDKMAFRLLELMGIPFAKGRANG
ncbi:MAG TPA: 50S ribosomal protein L5 [Campylobacterales bacterium]|nr:50S ribosomal protein L5 [Campylobacterales bacterium]